MYSLGRFGKRAGAVTPPRQLPVVGNPTKDQLCQMRKIAGAHSPAVHSHSPHIYYLVLTRRLPDHCPLICWRKEVAAVGWGGLKGRRSSFTVIIESFLLHEMDLGEGWNERRRVSDVIPQQAEASCNMACRFLWALCRCFSAARWLWEHNGGYLVVRITGTTPITGCLWFKS